MSKRIAVIQGHPDPDEHHLGYALADAYAEGERAAGHHVDVIKIAHMEFPLLRSPLDYEKGDPPETIRAAQKILMESEHFVLFYPMWDGTVPALLKAFIEQVFRPGFAYTLSANGGVEKHLKGKSARIVVTMGMPGFVYRWYYGAHGLRNLKRSILGFCGVRPIRHTLFGLVDVASDARKQKWFSKMRQLGAAGK